MAHLIHIRISEKIDGVEFYKQFPTTRLYWWVIFNAKESMMDPKLHSHIPRCVSQCLYEQLRLRYEKSRGYYRDYRDSPELQEIYDILESTIRNLKEKATELGIAIDPSYLNYESCTGDNYPATLLRLDADQLVPPQESECSRRHIAEMAARYGHIDA